jgi:Pyruvate/2-oxoacid:ferredoxin oxidoreductase delta subunit
MALWPAKSGNAINGLGEPLRRRPSPVYWHPPDSVPHGPLQRWFYSRPVPDEVVRARAERQGALDLAIAPLADERVERDAGEWTSLVKRAALAGGADVVGIVRMREEWVFENAAVPPFANLIVLGVAQSYEEMKTAPEPRSNAEVVRQYGRGIRAAKTLASSLRREGWDAVPHGGPMAGPIVLIPAAIACGLGELGKHGSIIHRELGSSFRLACVLTDVPLLVDAPDDLGVDDFCARCKLCADACPPDAILPEKQLVRGERRWYVDFDKCLPYFNEHMGCGICMVVCPWSRPGVAPTLVRQLSARRSRSG